MKVVAIYRANSGLNFHQIYDRDNAVALESVVEVTTKTLNRWRRLQKQADMLQNELYRAIQKERTR